MPTLKLNILVFLILIFITTNSCSQTKWQISKKGIGDIEIGNPIKESLNRLNEIFETKKTRFGTYQIFEKGEEIMLISLIPETNIIRNIRIYTDKWKTRDGLRIGLKIKEINEFNKDFFLEYDNQSGSEYYFRTEKIEKDNKTIETITKFHFIGTTPDYLGNYNFNEKTGKYDKSTDNNENGTLNFIEITLID